MIGSRARMFLGLGLGVATSPGLAVVGCAVVGLAVPSLYAATATAQTTSGGTEGRPLVVPPELVHYEPPVYPKAAEEAGKQAEVKLLITVDVDGTVTNAEVVEPQGFGFDEAAQEAAKKLTFQAATVNGEARKVKIGFSYQFKLEEKPKAEVAPPLLFGNLGGRLLIMGSDTPLVGATFIVTAPDGKTYQSVTNGAGEYSLEGLPSGHYAVRVVADGYEGFESTEEVVAGEAIHVTYRISPTSDELQVTVQGERPPREVTRRTLQLREVERIPGTNGDALRSIQSLPGVARPPGLAGLLIVRGSGPNETETFVDGANVPLIYHFGGLSSVVPTELLDKIDFYPGNFSVRFGRLTGGVVDVGIRKPNTDCYGDYGTVTNKKGCFHGLAQVDLVDARLMLEGPIPGTKNWSFAVAGRRSYIDTWLKPVLELAGSSVTSAPVYYDYQAILDYNPKPTERLSFRFFGSDDRFEAIITNPSANDPGFGGNIKFGTAFSRLQALYRNELTKKVSLESTLSVGAQSIEFGVGSALRFNLNSIPILGRSEFGFQLHETARLNTGIDFLGGSFEVDVRAPPVSLPGEASSGPLVTRPPRETVTSGFSFRPAWYTDLEWQPLRRLRLVPGVRVDYSRDTQKADLSPRANFRYFLFNPEDRAFFGQPRKTVLKGGIGKFSQPPQFQETDPIFGTPGITSNNTIHYSAGVEQGLTKQVEVSVEGFYKDYYDAVARAPNSDGVYTYNNLGDGHVIGLETLLKYNADERFFGWVSYTLSESKRNDCPNCAEYRFQYDQTHILVALGSYRLGDGWEIGARFRVVSGPLATPTQKNPLPSSIYSGDAGSYVAVEGAPYSVRLPLFHQLDVRVDKRWQFRDFRFSTYLDVQNVYNNAAVEGYVYNYNFTQTAYQTGIPILPSVGVRGEF